MTADSVSGSHGAFTRILNGLFSGMNGQQMSDRDEEQGCCSVFGTVSSQGCSSDLGQIPNHGPQSGTINYRLKRLLALRSPVEFSPR